MYILKIKGVEKAVDSIQIRDADFTLINYFKIKDLQKLIEDINIDLSIDEFEILIEGLPYGMILRIEK